MKAFNSANDVFAAAGRAIIVTSFLSRSLVARTIARIRLLIRFRSVAFFATALPTVIRSGFFWKPLGFFLIMIGASRFSDIKPRAFCDPFAFGGQELRVLPETYFSLRSRGCSFFSFSLVDMFGSYACFLIRYSTTGYFKTQFLLFVRQIITPRSPWGGVGLLFVVVSTRKRRCQQVVHN